MDKDVSTKIQNGQAAPEFELPDLHKRLHVLSELRGQIVVLNFWSAECPWAERADQVIEAYRQEWGNDVIFWWIASNMNEPVELLSEIAAQRELAVVLRDSRHKVADLYGAQTTPHLFVIDRQGLLRYQGALDDTNFRKRTASRSYLQEAVKAVLAGQDPDPAQTTPYGCTIVRALP
jgi:thiol-disulfide isomerase/thioredoxin